MSNNEVLEVITKAKDKYVKAIQLDIVNDKLFKMMLSQNSIQSGFCNFFRIQYAGISETILCQLRLDLIYPSGTDLSGLWYQSVSTLEFYYPTTVEEIKQQALQPRLDHLNRTIARLQDELKNVIV